jgi:hypothetical protein
MRWARHVALMGEIKNAYKILVGNLKRRDRSENRGVVERIILEWILGEKVGKVWTGCIWLRIGNTGTLLLTR